MKGQNIIVAGTPHFDETVYRLIATHLRINTNEKMRFLEVEDSCYKYWLHTYENKNLQHIQLWLIKTTTCPSGWQGETSKIRLYRKTLREYSA